MRMTIATNMQSLYDGMGRATPEAPVVASVEDAALEAAFRRAAVVNAVLVKLNTLDLGELAAESYHETIDNAIHALEHAMTPGTVQRAERALAEGAYQRLRAVEEVLRTREADFESTIALMSDAVVQFRDTNTSFTSEVLGRGESITELLIEDNVARLRARLSEEVDGLRRAAIAKQEADAHQIAALSARVSTLEARLAAAVAHANCDPLTGLPNRGAWEQHMTELGFRLMSGKLGAGIAVLDIDRFKQVNDTYGHAAGDAVLLEVARLCIGAFGADDFLARIGGDEIGVIVEAPTTEHAAAHIHRLIRSIRRFNEEQAKAGGLQFTVSAGLAVARRGERAPDLLRRADEAMYRAKRGGRDRLEIDG
jgi:diguanylate cyclase